MFANLPLSIRTFSILVFTFCLPSLSLNSYAQATQTLGSLEVDRLGAAVYNLPISAPNGIGGVKPNISALYNSQAANGLLGKGGSIGGLSVVKRCSQTLVRDGVNKAITWTAEDRFCIDAQRLMLIAGTQGAAESQYKTEIDNGVVYTAKGGTPGNPDYFEAIAEDGARLVFGGAATAKEQGAATMTWALSQYKDATNNAIEYTYEGTAADGLRIKRINYAFPIPNTTTNPGAYIEFTYKERDDPISKYVAGYEFRTNKLLTQINSYSLLGLLHRSYQFDLATSSGLAGYVTRWQGVDECKSFTICFSISQFTWGTTKKSSRGFVELKDISVEWLNIVSKKAQYGYSPTDAKLSDLTGDGIAELVWNERDSDYYTHTFAAFNVGTLAFDAFSMSSTRYATLSETNAPLVGLFQFADINSDGRNDLIIPGYYDSSSNMARPKGLVVERNNRYWALSETGLSVGNGDRFAIFADLDGDGLLSQINMSRDLTTVSINKARKDLNKTVEQRDYYGFNEPLHSRQNIFSDLKLKGSSDIIQTILPWEKSFVVGDFDGDLKQDLLSYFAWYSQAENATAFKLNWYSYTANQLQLKKNLFLDKKTGYSANSQGQLNDQVGLAGLNVPDINGDGLSDIAFRIGANWRYALSKGEGFTEYVSWPSTPGSANWDPVWFFDVNRDGSEDVIRYSYDSVSKNNIYYVNYWVAKENKFSEANAIRSTPYHPLTVGDANGDSWLDFVELDGTAKSNNQDYIRIYGYTNTSGTFLNGHPGVLAADAITQIKSGIVADATIAYQPMSRSNPMKEELCSSAHSSQKIPCQNFHGNSNYKILKESVVLPPLSFDATSLDYKPYYKATNEPFAVFENPYVNQARVSNWLKPVPIVTEIKESLRTGLVSKTTTMNKQFTYWHMRSQAGGRGLLGYEKTLVKDLLTGNSLETTLRQDWPYTGITKAITKYTSYGKILSETVNALSTSAIGSQLEKVYKPKVDSITEKNYSLKAGGAEQGDLITNTTASAQSSSKSTSAVIVANTSATPNEISATPSSYNLNVDRLGAAVYALPISAPNGVGGVKPNITALYNSQAANGLLGKGGSIGGLSVIKRCQQTLVRDGVNKAISWTAEDRFCIDSQRLMLVAGAQGSAESQYKTEIDNGVVYTAKGGTAGNPDYFEAHAEDGATLLFGGVASAKEQGAATMTWALSHYKDAASNAIEYVYEGVAADGLRIKRINYAFPIPGTTSQPGAYIEFVYKDRDDPISKYVAGYEFRTNKLLTQINSYSLLELLHRSYQFDLATSSGLAGYVTRWQGVDECFTYSNCFSSTQFKWGTTEVDHKNEIQLKSIKFDWIANIPTHGISTYSSIDIRHSSPFIVADINGNGINDFIWTEKGSDDYYHIFKSYDPGVLPFDSPKRSRRITYIAEAKLKYLAPASVADINFDNINDFLLPNYYSSPESSGLQRYISGRTINEWSYIDEKHVGEGVGVNFYNSMDLNGDGYEELVVLNEGNLKGRIHSFFKDTSKSLNSYEYYKLGSSINFILNDITLTGLYSTVGAVSSDYNPGDVDFVKGDFNGDGADEFLINIGAINTQSTQQDFSLRRYSIEAGAPVYMGSVFEEKSNTIYQYSDPNGYKQRDKLAIKSLQTPDINGDGLADVGFGSASNKWQYSISNGRKFNSLVVSDNNDNGRIFFFDVNKDGSNDFVGTKFNNSSKKYEIYVKFWLPKTSVFSGASYILRETTNYPYLIADFNGDSWVDVLEYDSAAKYAGQEYLKIYGFTDPSLQTEAGGQGVLAIDAITQIKVGLRVSFDIEYQSLIRPAKPVVSKCRAENRDVTCQSHWESSHYKPNKIDVALRSASLDASAIEADSYYARTNNPLSDASLGQQNARVSQYLDYFPIVTRVRTSSTDQGILKIDLDKKYYYKSIYKQAGGRGLLGFEKIKVDNTVSGESTETEYRIDWPYAGLPSASYYFANNGALLKTSSFAFVATQSAPMGTYKLDSKRKELNYSPVSGELVTVSLYENDQFVDTYTPFSPPQSSSANSSSSLGSNPHLVLNSPNTLETYTFPYAGELAILATPTNAAGQIKNADGTNPKINFYINGMLQNALRPDPGSRIKFWKPPMAGEFVVEAETTLEDGTYLRSKPGIFKLNQVGAPVVSLTKPTAGARYKHGESILLTASATDSDGFVRYVGFYDNGVLIGSSDDTAPFLTLWTPLIAGEHRMSVVAVDSAGIKTTSGSISIFVDSLSSVSSSSASSSSKPTPYAELSSPKQSITEKIGLGAEFPLLASVKNPDGTIWLDNDDQEAKIEFYANGNLLTNVKKDPAGIIIWWKPEEAGTYNIKAIGHLGGGRSVVSQESILVVTKVGMPVVNLTAPSSDIFIKRGDSIQLAATASDPDGDLSGVSFYINNYAINPSPLTSAPFAFEWQPQNVGEYVIRAVASDRTFVKSTSLTRRITVVEPGTKPAVTLISPDNGISVPFGSVVSLFANAQDFDGTIAKVEFYANNQLVGTSTSAPYRSSFTLKSAGLFEFKAVAYDNLGNVSTSAVHSVQHGLAAPSLSGIELDDDCFFGVNFNASKNSSNDLVFELYERTLGTEWAVKPVAQKSLSLGDIPPFKVYFADHAPGDFEYRSRICPINNLAACSSYSETMPIAIYSGCKSFTLPTVNLINPPLKLKLGDSVVINAEASTSKHSISNVRFYYGDKLLGVDYTAPYSVSWTATETGRDYLYAQAEGTNEGTAVSDMHIVEVLTLEDYANGAASSTSRSSSSSSNVSVVSTSSNSFSSSSQSSLVPQIALFTPEPGKVSKTYLGDDTMLFAAVYDQELRPWKNQDGSSPRIEYYVNNQLITDLRNDVASGIKYWKPTALGNYGIKATAYLDGQTLTTSVGVISVVKPLPPSISLEVFQGTKRYAGSLVNVVTTVVDPDMQTREVKFFANGEQIALPDFDAPYEAGWIPTLPGTYQLQAELLDKLGNVIRSPVATMTVEPAILPDFDGVRGVSDLGDAQLQGLKWTPINHSDVLVSKTPNAGKVSYNKLTKFNVKRPLKIINRADAYTNAFWAAKLIVIDAQEIVLNSSIEIIGEPADILLLNSSASKLIQCSACGFKNVGRVTLAVATPSAPLSNSITTIGTLATQVGGIVSVDNLQAGGVASIELLAEKVSSNGVINTLQYTTDATGKSIGDVVIPGISKVVGSGGVSVLHGRLDVAYETMKVQEIRAGAPILELNANIASGAINVISTAPVTISGNLNTASELRAVTQYQGKLHAQAETIAIKTLAADAVSKNSITLNAALITDGKVELTSQGDIHVASQQASISGHALALNAVGNFKNYGDLIAKRKLWLIGLSNSEPSIQVGAKLIENRGSVDLYEQLEQAGNQWGPRQISGNLSLASESDVLNRFGGFLRAKTIKVAAQSGRIRNGSLYAFDDPLKENELIAAISHDTQAISTLSSLPISDTKPYLNPKATIQGMVVQLEAGKSVENINPYTEPVKQGSAEEVDARVSRTAQTHVDDVRIEAVNKLTIVAPHYVLNSSANLGVSEFSLVPALIIQSPLVRNERYYSYTVLDAVDETKQVVEQNPGSTSTTTSSIKGVKARYGFYSPPGTIYSFAPVQIQFGVDANNTNAGLLNNAGFIDIYSTMNLYGVGRATSLGVKLDKLAYETTSNTRTVLKECISKSYWNGYAERSYEVCEQGSYDKIKTPEGKYLEPILDNTLFAVAGRLDAKGIHFSASNHEVLKDIREQAINDYMAAQKARSYLPFDPNVCREEKSVQLSNDGLFVTTRVNYFTKVSADVCPQRGHGETKAVSELVAAKVSNLPHQLNSMISRFESWKPSAAQ